MEKKFYEETWFAVLMLFFVLPVGLFLMWRYDKFNQVIRIIITVVLGLWFLLWAFFWSVMILGTLLGDSSTSTETNAPVENTEKTAEEIKVDEEQKKESEAKAKAEKEKEKLEAEKQKSEEEAKAKAEAKEKAKKEAEALAKEKAEEEARIKAEEEAEAERERQEAQSAKERKANARSISFKELDKRADSLKGEYVKYYGKIVEIGEEGDFTYMRLALHDKELGSFNYDHLVFVTYDDTTNFYEDDEVVIHGEILGAYTYQSQANWNISLPWILADSIE